MSEKVTKLCHIWIILFCFCSRRVKQNRRAYESHLCMRINQGIGKKESLESNSCKIWKFEREKKKRKRNFSRCFFPVFDYQSTRCERLTWKICFSFGWEFPRLCFIALLPYFLSRLSLGNVWSSCFPHSRENLTESRGILIRRHLTWF